MSRGPSLYRRKLGVNRNETVRSLADIVWGSKVCLYPPTVRTITGGSSNHQPLPFKLVYRQGSSYTRDTSCVWYSLLQLQPLSLHVEGKGTFLCVSVWVCVCVCASVFRFYLLFLVVLVVVLQPFMRQVKEPVSITKVSLTGRIISDSC